MVNQVWDQKSHKFSLSKNFGEGGRAREYSIFPLVASTGSACDSVVIALEEK